MEQDEMDRDERERADTTGLPIDDRPEVHQTGSRPGGTSPISLEMDKDIREGNLPADRFDDYRMKELPQEDADASDDTGGFPQE
ncbi:MAG: hypothetical protein AB7Q29_13565 [Vicinamibacterales bacterium]